jgi:uncharacterized membrane protein
MLEAGMVPDEKKKALAEDNRRRVRNFRAKKKGAKIGIILGGLLFVSGETKGS